MPIENLLTHRANVILRVAVLDDEGLPELDVEGQPVTAEQSRSIACDIQPNTAREAAALNQAGAAVSTHTIYTVDRAITTADAIWHDPDDCPAPRDLPEMWLEITATPDAAGRGHHLEIGATMVGSRRPEAVGSGTGPVGSGSGS